MTNELLRLNRALKTLGAGNHTVLRASDEPQLLRDMCHVIVDTGQYRMAFVVYAENNEKKTTRWMFGLGPHIETPQAYPFTWADTEPGGTVTGTAIRTGQPVVGRSFLSKLNYAGPEYARFQKQASSDGYGAVSAFPLHVEGKVLGALVIAAEEPDAFDSDEVDLLTQLADDLAYGISHLRVSLQNREANAAVLRLHILMH